jgi:hypothetical protein
MIVIKPTAPPRTEFVIREYDNKQVKWVEKPLSTLTDESIAQFNPLTGKQNWAFDHYVWIIEETVSTGGCFPYKKNKEKRKGSTDV